MTVSQVSDRDGPARTRFKELDRRFMLVRFLTHSIPIAKPPENALSELVVRLYYLLTHFVLVTRHIQFDYTSHFY